MNRVFRDYAYGWVIGIFFVVSIVIFLVAGWYEYVAEQIEHGAVVDTGHWATIMTRAAFENIQSEMLQLLCQVGLLTWLIFKGSPQSKDTEDRLERKIDEIRRVVNRMEADWRIQSPPPPPPSSF